MRASQFKIVFSLNLFHSYFEGGINNNWTYQPGKETMTILERYKFKIDVRTDGFDLYVNTENNLSSYLDYISKSVDQDYFEFNITTSDEFIYMATEIPVGEVGYFKYDNHYEKNNVEPDKIELKGVWTPVEDSKDLAQLRLYFDDLQKFFDLNQTALYQINIDGRSTQWQYYIVNNSGLELENLKIVGKSDINFEGPEEVKLQDGQRALQFISGSRLISLSEIPKDIFDLISSKETTENIKSKNKMIVKGLPNPSLGHFGTIENNGHTVVTSPMYVFV